MSLVSNTTAALRRFTKTKGTGASGDHGYLERYNRMSIKSAHEVIAQYSTSFSMSTSLLRGQVRTDIRNLYAMVRIADEIVDGTAKEAGYSTEEISAMLDAYEEAVLAAPHTKFHTDPVLHAYGLSARRCNFKDEHIKAFFKSMRRDLHQSGYNEKDFESYVYGSAEVIGLLCVAAFMVEHPVSDAERERLDEGARRLGAAFQKVNFLRDLAEDTDGLGRDYFPQLQNRELTEETKQLLVDDINADLDAAYAVIPLLPVDARIGVRAAADLFKELNNQIEALPAAHVATTRVSVSNATKLSILARAIRTSAL